MPCKTLETYPLFFDERGFGCLVGFMRESGDSGSNIGLDGEAKSRKIFSDPRTILRAV